eukprot:CAMPEP_0113936240 /NCGR_PEP_ID=MMETSP1339-20121228/3200_1 /TAXON_ID=94617 /ORGANISM="Fibrocapsa japonica" /LENGTH=95 /DNA_ID=CAMNT_0000938645 /DNA_START=156 /DNA_END=443 /DNA_ORIENTATION=+ /assembly_acc=CAM_ASM_000762
MGVKDMPGQISLDRVVRLFTNRAMPRCGVQLWGMTRSRPNGTETTANIFARKKQQQQQLGQGRKTLQALDPLPNSVTSSNTPVTIVAVFCLASTL